MWSSLKRGCRRFYGRLIEAGEVYKKIVMCLPSKRSPVRSVDATCSRRVQSNTSTEIMLQTRTHAV